MNKKVLVITPFCAPETHAAVFRAHKLVKYLKREGWQPIILTVDTNYTYNEDLGLLKELEGIPIYRTRYVEPTLRGLKMWLTGKDLTYKTLKKNGVYDNSFSNSENDLKTHKPKPIQQVYHYLLVHYLKKPDRFWTWKKNAIKKAKEIIKQENVEFIYTTCLPYTTNQIGIILKKQTRVKWIADFRDPITYARRMHSDIPHVYKLQRKIQDETLKFADQITVLSSAYKLILHDQYEGKFDHKIAFIPTGVDDDYIDKVKQKNNTIVFVGEYLKEYRDYFFKLYDEVLNILPEDKQPEFKIIGNKTINAKQVLPIINNLKFKNKIELIDHLPQQQLYKYIQQSNYCLLIPGAGSHWWTNFAKMVDYIAFQKKVIALVPRISEAKSELQRAGLGVFLTQHMEEDKEMLKKLFLQNLSITQCENSYSNRYLASRQTQSFIDVFKSLAYE